MFVRLAAVVITAVFTSGAAFASEGLWQPDHLPLSSLNKTYGFAPDTDWIARTQRSSVGLTGGCSGAFVSPDGLVLTTRRCVETCVQKVSTADTNYVVNGYYASTGKDELACPGLGMDRLDAIEDISARIKQVLAGKAASDVRAVKRDVENECASKGAPGTHCEVVGFHGGATYSLYRYHRFDDVRLVFSPEGSVATFGGDPNNFEFPRYAFDVALLRAYENGKPVASADYFPLSTQGAKAGELTIAISNPVGGSRAKTLAQLQTDKDRDITHGLMRFGELRGVLTRYIAESDEHRRIAQGDLFAIERAFKMLRGQFEALQNADMLARKRADEQSLQDFVASDAMRKAKYGLAWDEIDRAQATYRELELPFQFKEGRGGFFSKYLGFAKALVRGAAEQDAVKRGEHVAERQSETQQLFSTAPVYPEYEKVKFTFTLTQVRDGLGLYYPFVQKAIGNESPKALANRLVDGTRLGDIAFRKALQEGGTAAIEKSDDTFVQLARLIEPDAKEVRKAMDDYEALVGRNMRLIEQARFEKYGNDAYPNPTATQRFSFGTVEGWHDGSRQVAPFADIGALFARANSEAPFMLPPSWLAAKMALTPQQHLNFVTSNDVIGSDKGAALINRQRELVGFVYSGNAASLGGDFWFDERRSRAVSVHSGALLEILRTVYKADRIVAEIDSAGRR